MKIKIQDILKETDLSNYVIDPNSMFNEYKSVGEIIDAYNMDTLDRGNNDVTVSTNLTDAFVFFGNLSYIRGQFVSETGGTAAKVDFKYSGAV